jgi:flagellar protein FlaI
MANFPLPFNVREQEEKCEIPETCEFVASLDDEFRAVVAKNAFLHNYLHRVPIDEIGLPTYRPQLDRKDGEAEKPNFIYPTDKGGLFVHIFGDPDGGRANYISIEPSINHPQMREIMVDIEEALLDYTDELEAAEGDEQLGLMLAWALDTIFGRRPEKSVDDILAIPVVKKGSGRKGEEKLNKKPAPTPADPVDAAVEKEAEEAARQMLAAAGKDEDGEGTVAVKTRYKRKGRGKSPLAFGPLSKLFSADEPGRNVDLAAKWKLDNNDVDGIKYVLLKDKVGVGTLQPLINDSGIEDISCSGVGRIFVEHKVFKSMVCSFGYGDDDELDEHVLRLSERIKKPVTYRQPVVDASLPDGSRINIVYGRDVSLTGSNYTIRKFAEDPLSILQLCLWQSISYEAAAYLSICLEDGMNMFVSGETASGKTTLMNALTVFIEPNAKIVSIEDTAEVNVPHTNWLREVVRKAKPGEKDSGVGMFDLLKAALRQRPNEIIIGEIRGEEGLIAFQAMQTGHPVMATFHAASVQKLIQRVVGDPILVPKNYVDNLNLCVIQEAVRLPNGKRGRRCTSISEIVNYDSLSDSFSFVEVFKWDPVTDKFEFVGLNNSYLLEQRIAPSRGYPASRRRQIYSLVKRRARILEKLANSGLTDYYETFKVISKAINEGVF